MIVRFINDEDIPVFECVNDKGDIKSFDYNLPIPSDVDKFNMEDYANQYAVDLLINPFLSKGKDMYCLKHSGFNHIIGMIFPVTNLDEKDLEISNKKQYDFFFVAFYALLKRLKWDEIKETCFSDNFEENICVCVFNKKQAANKNPLHLCIHSLRKYGYSYFEPNNRIEKPEGYNENLYKPKGRTIKVGYEKPLLYSNGMVRTLLEELPRASNIIHRFVLLYQIIELLLDVTMTICIDEQYKNFKDNKIPNNDFLHSIGEKMSEKVRINDIFERCNIKGCIECRDFDNSCKVLFRDISYPLNDNTDISEIYYKFRNQITHRYRNLIKYKSDLEVAIQDFERLTMLIVEKYPYRIQ